MHAVTVELPPPINHIFVDFENVHAIEPGSAGSNGVSFMLLLGPRQKLEATLLERLLESCTLLQLVRVTASGRNALDFTLAYYVGRAVAADPSGVFHIISKDKGYDPLVEHLRGKRIEAYRHNDFASVTFWGSPKSSAPISPPAAETVKRSSYGDNPNYTNLGQYSWYADNSGGTTQPVGQKLPNPWGLYDTSGNVWEWCLDWYAPYPGGIALDPHGPTTGVNRVFRGGSWVGPGYGGRSAQRFYNLPTITFHNIGFRVVLAPGQP